MSEIEIDLRCCSAESLLKDLFNEDVKADAVFADPPWEYDNGALQGGVDREYKVLDIQNIATDFYSSYSIARTDAYAVLWCTFPKMEDWTLGWKVRCDIAAEIWGHPRAWKYVTGGTWGKTNGLGPGHHLRGDAEVFFLYKKGAPKPLTTQSNLILDRRVGHSEKPQEALQALVELTAAPGGLVLDLYAGESGSLARACRATGRRYVGCEIDPKRHANALDKLALAEQRTFWGWRREPIANTE